MFYFYLDIDVMCIYNIIQTDIGLIIDLTAIIVIENNFHKYFSAYTRNIDIYIL